MEKDEPKQRGKEVRLQARVRGGLASGSPSSCPHGPPVPMAQPWHCTICGHCRALSIC